jgi:hypothetical protein
MAFARAAEARLEQIVRGERREARRQRPLAAHQDPDDRRFEIVVLMCPASICAGARVGERSALVDRGGSDT